MQNEDVICIFTFLDIFSYYALCRNMHDLLKSVSSRDKSLKVYYLGRQEVHRFRALLMPCLEISRHYYVIKYC